MGRERLGTGSVPTCRGLLTPESEGRQLVPSLVVVVVAFGGGGEHCVFGVSPEDDGANRAWIIPGSTVPMDPTIVRRIRADARVVFAALLVRRPGVHRVMQFVSDKIRR